jgi:esterase/lipase
MPLENKSTCFILLPGFSPDNYPVQDLKEQLEDKGYQALASNFYGPDKITNFSDLTSQDCQDNICAMIAEAKKKYETVVGIGISLGGALLLEHAKKNENLDAVISIGTPFKLKNVRLINTAEKFIPIIKPFWLAIDRRKRRLPPINATKMVMNYLCREFPADLEKISVPVLLLHSKKDHVTDHHVLENYFQKIGSRKKRLVFFDNGGHVINGGTKKVLELAFDFLAE